MSARLTSIPARRFTSVTGKSITRLLRLRVPGHRDGRRLATAQVDHHAGRELQPGHHEGRVYTAFESVAGIRVDPELTAGMGDVHRLPQRRLDQHIGGRARASARLAAHDAGERLDALRISDHAHAGIEGVGLAVERGECLAWARAPHNEIARHLGGVENVQRACPVEGDVVGDIDQCVDRAQSNRDQSSLQPIRTRAVLHAAHQTKCERRTQRWRRAEIEIYAHRTRKSSLDRFDRSGLERSHAGGCEIACNTCHASAVRSIGRKIDFDHRVVESGPGGVALADRRVRRADQ